MKKDVERIQKAMSQGKLKECQKLFEHVFSTHGPDPQTIHLYALWHHAMGQPKQALSLLRGLLHKQKKLPHAIWNDLGALYAENNENALAEQCFRQALAQQPENLTYALHYGQALSSQARYENADLIYKKILAKEPDFDTCRHLAVTNALKMGALKTAESLFNAFNKQNTHAHLAHSEILAYEKTSEAITFIENLPTEQQTPLLKEKLAEYYTLVENHAGALKIYTQLLTLDPSHQKWTQLRNHCYFNLGVTLKKEAHYKQSELYLALYLKEQPHDANALYNMGNLHHAQKQHPEAEQWYRKSLKVNQEFTEAWINLTLSCYEQAHYAEAEAAAENAVRLSPENARAHIGYGDALLMRKKYKEGFEEVEWRFKEAHYKSFHYPAPAWEGEDLNEKTLLVMSEQGLGDIIMFSRFIPEIQKKHPKANIIFRSRSELQSLFNHWDYPFYKDGQVIKDADYAVALMSLLRLLKVNPPTLPAPNYLKDKYKCPSEVVALLAANKLKIGVVWCSGTGLTQAKRSIAWEHFQRLIETYPEYEFYGLQKGPAEKEAEEKPIDNYTSLAPFIEDLADTAGCCQHLDLVISVDTSVAHLAGALNCPVWILLPFAPDWRWGNTAVTTEWYPSAQLFRQQLADAWEHVFFEVTSALSTFNKPVTYINF